MSRKRYVGTSISRVITDDLIPSAIKNGTASAALLNKDVMESINTALTDGLASKGRNYYSYGKNMYTHGLPQGYPLTSVTGAAEVEDVIQDVIEGTEVVMSYSFFGDLNYYHIANTILLEDYGYDPITEELSVLTAAKGWPVTLDYNSLVLTQDMLDTASEDSLKNLEGDCRVRVDSGATAIGFEITYSWEEIITNHFPLPPTIVPHTETLTVASDLIPTGYDNVSEYFHAQYVIGSTTKYFLYRKGDGTYTSLDVLFDGSPIDAGTYYPWIHFRNNFTPITAVPESEEYLTSRRLAKRIGLDLDSLSDSISENPDIGDVIQAVLMFAIPPETTNPLEQKYLYEYFDNMFLGLGGTVTSLDAASLIASLTIEDLVKKSIVIKDPKLTTSLSNRGLYRRLVTGTIGAVGTYGSTSSSFSTVSMEYTEDGITMQSIGQNVSSLLYRKQVSITQYEEIQILGLTCQYRVVGAYYTTGDIEYNNITLIPLDLAVVQLFAPLDKETLYARAMHFVFNSTVVIKVEWYQTFWFRFILTVLAVVVLVKSVGTGIKVSLALIELGIPTVFAIAAFVLQVVAVPLIFKELVDVLGLENSIIVLILVSLYTGKVVFSAETLKQGLMSAETLLMYASGLIGGISDMTNELIGDISEEMSQFSADMKVKMDELEKINKEMNQSNVLNPLMLLGETPDEYYNRTVHSGNIGVKVYETVSKYVQTMLTLPEFNGFFESTQNGIS